MSLFSRTIITLVASIGILLAAAVPASGKMGGVPFTVDLTGEAEVTAQGGDPDGSGTASLRINPGLGQLCRTIEVTRVDAITAAHIHVAPATASGPVVVPLNPYTGGCAEVDRDIALAIILDPDSYYVNVHNAAYPGGALRGQLDR